MFRALHVFSPDKIRTGKITLEAPLSVTLVDNNGGDLPHVELAIASDAIFTTAVGHSSKRTMASWHLTTPEEVVDHMLHLVGETSRGVSAAPTGGEGEEGKSYM